MPESTEHCEEGSAQAPDAGETPRAARGRRTSLRRPGGCHALRPAYRPGPEGASAEDWLKAIR
jgi:hypothetical protein